jgi:hypothetical protein
LRPGKKQPPGLPSGRGVGMCVGVEVSRSSCESPDIPPAARKTGGHHPGHGHRHRGDARPLRHRVAPPAILRDCLLLYAPRSICQPGREREPGVAPSRIRHAVARRTRRSTVSAGSGVPIQNGSDAERPSRSPVGSTGSSTAMPLAVACARVASMSLAMRFRSSSWTSRRVATLRESLLPAGKTRLCFTCWARMRFPANRWALRSPSVPVGCAYQRMEEPGEGRGTRCVGGNSGFNR